MLKLQQEIKGIIYCINDPYHFLYDIFWFHSELFIEINLLDNIELISTEICTMSVYRLNETIFVFTYQNTELTSQNVS